MRPLRSRKPASSCIRTKVTRTVYRVRKAKRRKRNRKSVTRVLPKPVPRYRMHRKPSMLSPRCSVLPKPLAASRSMLRKPHPGRMKRSLPRRRTRTRIRPSRM